jgi:hypothetical protein
VRLGAEVKDFYTKVVATFATGKGLRLVVTGEVTGVSKHWISGLDRTSERYAPDHCPHSLGRHRQLEQSRTR